MSLSIERFDEFFGALYQKEGKPLAPFPWQSRLAKQVFTEGWPDCIDLPTASGKTAAIDIAVFVLACQADRETKDRTVGRRIFFAVNRRVIVDEAFNRAAKLAQALIDADGGILKEVADALHKISGDKNTPPLDVAELRGGIYRDRAWARSITQPIVVCTTADQLGSRLLFRGYGVTASSAPIHAALCGCDSLVLLDEAHVTKAFSQTLQLLTRYQSQHRTAPAMRYVQMTATPTENVRNRFALDDADNNNPVLKARQKASKPAMLHKPLNKKESIASKMVESAFGALSETRKAIGIIVNRVQTARDIERLIREKVAKLGGDHEAEVHLVIGRMRPIDRDDLQEKLRTLVGPDRPDVLVKPVFIVATQCLEVGADYDFDALITECASIDALRQRMGRLNRKGRSIEVKADIFAQEESLKDDDPIYGAAIKHTWEWLTEDGRISIDFRIRSFKEAWEKIDGEKRLAMLAPAPNAAVLLPAHLDALCQTSPQPVPSPDVSYFIHGPRRDNAEVNVCWRADLGGEPNLWPDIVRLLPPTSPECMTVPLVALKRWMGERINTDADADVPVNTIEPDEKREPVDKRSSVSVVIWRFGQKPGDTKETKRRLVGFVTNDPREVRPGDTVVMPVSSQSWIILGHIPYATDSSYEKSEAETDEDYSTRCASVDVAERATRQSKLRFAIRLHTAFSGRIALRELPAKELRPFLESLLEKEITEDEEIRRALVVLKSSFDRHKYPTDEENNTDDNPETKHNEIIDFRTFLARPKQLELPVYNEDDGEDDLSESNRIWSLQEHTQHVIDQLDMSLSKLHLYNYEQSLHQSAVHHDLGKADVRFQAMLAGITPYEAMERKKLLGKGDGIRRTKAEQNLIFERAMYPRGFRHEMLSVELIEHLKLESNISHRDLLLHLIAAHHGYARPFAPVCFDDAEDDELRSLKVNESEVPGSVRKNWVSSHRLDSGVAERFWKLTREHGWWGLAWLETILRLADQQASVAEQEGKINE